jgi:hypothetical protein
VAVRCAVARTVSWSEFNESASVSFQYSYCVCVFDGFLTQNSPKQGNALSKLLFNFALDYAVRKAQSYQIKGKGTDAPELF